jgi:hypothetical protein
MNGKAFTTLHSFGTESGGAGPTAVVMNPSGQLFGVETPSNASPFLFRFVP